MTTARRNPKTNPKRRGEEAYLGLRSETLKVKIATYSEKSPHCTAVVREVARVHCQLRQIIHADIVCHNSLFEGK